MTDNIIDFPEPEDDIQQEGFDSLVDRLMNLHGYELEEAEARALAILEDDAA